MAAGKTKAPAAGGGESDGDAGKAPPPAKRSAKPLRAYTVREDLTRAGKHYKQGERIAVGQAEAARLLRSGAIGETP